MMRPLLSGIRVTDGIRIWFFCISSLASLLAAPSAKVSYALTCATGSYIFVGNNATLTYVNKAPLNPYGGA
jgi:hypothetical protein